MDRPDQGSEVRTRLPAGGRWIRTSGSPFGNDDFRFAKGKRAMENTRGVSSRGPNGCAASVISATEIWSSPAGVCRRKSAIFHSARRAGWLVRHRPAHLDAGLSTRRPSR